MRASGLLGETGESDPDRAAHPTKTTSRNPIQYRMQRRLRRRNVGRQTARLHANATGCHTTAGCLVFQSEDEMNPQHTLILGAGYAGQMAAARIAKRRPDARLTVVDASPVFVERIRLHQIAAGGHVRARPMEAVLPNAARFVRGRVTAWDVAARRVTVTTEAGPTDLHYDSCVHTLGSRVHTTVPGVAQHAHTLDDPAGAARAAAAIQPRSRILIVGAGLTGIEAATEIGERRRDVAVTLVASGTLGANLSGAGAQHVRDVLTRLNVEIREHTHVRALNPDAAIVNGNDRLPFDVCLWAGGFVANPLARDAGLPVNSKGQIRVDDTLRIPDHPEIFVAGDAAEVAGPDGEPLRMACATAMPTGTYVGEAVAKAIAKEPIKPFRFAYKIRCISLGRRNGLIQHVDEADRPVPQVWTGRAAAALKEIVCRSTVMAIRGEGRLRIPFYRWPQPTSPTVHLQQPAAIGD
jgi:NADH dehydrogenase FAD-containing subunit